MPSWASWAKLFIQSDGNTSSSAEMLLAAGCCCGQRARVAGEGQGGEPASSAGGTDVEASTTLWFPLHRRAPEGKLSAYKLPTVRRTGPDLGLEDPHSASHPAGT